MEPGLYGCPITWTSPTGTHSCMHRIDQYHERHEPYPGSPSFITTGAVDSVPQGWDVRMVPRAYDGRPTEAPFGATRPVARPELPTPTQTPLQELADAADGLYEALGNIGVAMVTPVLNGMLRVARWLERVTRPKR